MEEFSITRVQIEEKLKDFTSQVEAKNGIETWLAVKGCGPIEISQILKDLNSYQNWSDLI